MDYFYEVERFHFKLDSELLKKLNEFADYWGETISDAVNRIVSSVYFLMEKFEYEAFYVPKEGFQESELVMDNNIKITIRKKYKSKMFNMQARFHLRSKASLLRFIIRKYFEKMKKWRRDGHLKRDVRKRSFRMWQNKKSRVSYGSYVEWGSAKSGHMNLHDIPQIIYLYDRNNRVRNISYINALKNVNK